jgi:hypothetical protein
MFDKVDKTHVTVVGLFFLFFYAGSGLELKHMKKGTAWSLLCVAGT